MTKKKIASKYKAGRQQLDLILNSYSEIFFVKNKIVGLLLFAVTLVSPNIAFSGILAVAAAYLFARFIHLQKYFLASGFYTYNALLVGLSIGYLFQTNLLTIFFVITSSILTFVLTVLLQDVFYRYFRLPVLSVPFVIVSSLAYLASSRYSGLFVYGLYPHLVDQFSLQLPLIVSGYFKALGAIFFMPRVLPGVILAVIILFSSRILFFLSLLGYYSGAFLTALLVGSFQQAFSNINHFNFILIAMAIGGVFLIPSKRSYLLAVIAVCVSTLILDSALVFWSNYGIPGFTLPFNIVSLSFVYILGLTQYPQMARLIKNTPEETLDAYLTNKERFKGAYRTITLPFSGAWTVWQGFDGEWTHQGSWRFAYDFIITDTGGNSFRGEGAELKDYFCFRKPVLAPVRGRVVKVVDRLPDNKIGFVEKTDNWGNLVVIYDPRGFYVEISHFARESLKVAEGDWVERGTLLGLCGNSGYSPQPHIHVQVQEAEAVGSYTVPFSFVSYREGKQYHSNDLPPLNAIVEPLYMDKNLDMQTSFILDQEIDFAIRENDQSRGNLRLKVNMAPDGTFYFNSGPGKLYFGKHEGTFYFYSVDGDDAYLNLILTALPRLPLVKSENLQWSDHIPSGMITRGWKRGLVQFISSFYHDYSKISVKCVFSDENTVTTQISSTRLNLNKTVVTEMNENGLWKIRSGNIELRRVENA